MSSILEKKVGKKNEKVIFDIIPKRNKEYISLSYGCIRFIDSYRFLTTELGILVKTLDSDDLNVLKKTFQINGEI